MMGTVWKPLLVVAGLLLLLTYLLLRSWSPDPALRARMHDALHAFELHDAELNRDALLARAGLLGHYDSLSQAINGLYQPLETLRSWGKAVSGEAAEPISQHIADLATAVQQKETLLEYFKADNALLLNSLMYFIHTGHTLSAQMAARDATLAAAIGTLSNTMLRFVRTPQREVGDQIIAILERLPTAPPFQQDLYTLAAHARLIVDVLPQVDAMLGQLLAAPTTARARALRDASLQYHNQAEARAQTFRLLLYAVAVVLLAYLVYLSARLRANARDLGRVNADLRREMAERTQAEEALRESEERFRAITEIARDAIITVDSNGHVVSWNTGAQSMFGYEAVEVLGSAFTRLVPEREQAAQQSELQRCYVAGASRVVGNTIEIFGVRQDGSAFPLEMSVSSWTTARGTYVTRIMRDIAERKRLEDKTRQQELQLIQANKMTALGTLVAGVAHEINNPTNLVLMNARVLAESWSDATTILETYHEENGDFLLGGLPYTEMRETIPALIRDVHAGAQRIERIVQSLKDFSRPRSHTVQATLHLNDAVQRALTLLHHLITRTTTGFHVDLAEDLPPLQGDIQQLEQVVVNLVVNALEALPGKDRGVTVATRYHEAEHGVELEVRDQGIGIPQEHLERLCNPFFTTKQEHGGIGLGLAITYTLVRDHGGSLAFESVPGQGTRALVMLPCAAESPHHPPEVAPAPGESAGVPVCIDASSS